MEKIKITLNVIIVTCVIGLAISYLTQLIPLPFKLNFLEILYTIINYLNLRSQGP